MMLINRQTQQANARWIVATIAGSLAALAWYLAESWGAERWPGGSSRVGLWLGSIAGAIILFELLLWPRKHLRRLRMGKAQSWMRAHLWLGILCVPLVILHSGGRLGSPMSTTLALVFGVVIASGLWGLAMQQVIPRMILHRVPAETIAAEIPHLAAQNCESARQLVRAACGAPAGPPPATAIDERETVTAHVMVGSFREIGRTRGKVLQSRSPVAPIAQCGALQLAFNSQIEPYLREGAPQGYFRLSPASPLADSISAEKLFQDLKARLPDAAESIVDELAELCFQRRQFDLQLKLNGWLHGWLLIHTPLSCMLFALLLVHIYVACRYW